MSEWKLKGREKGYGNRGIEKCGGGQDKLNKIIRIDKGWD